LATLNQKVCHTSRIHKHFSMCLALDNAHLLEDRIMRPQRFSDPAIVSFHRSIDLESQGLRHQWVVLSIQMCLTAWHLFTDLHCLRHLTAFI